MPPPKGTPPIDDAPLFSAPEPVRHYAKTGGRPPATNPFQAPDFGEAADDAAGEEPATEPGGHRRG